MADSVHAPAVNFPPGFRFRPSDEEIVGYYLKNKVHGNKFEFEVIREVDLYKCEPWDLPEKSILSSRDLEWYFFCPRDRKYPNGSRSNRATEKGYWKATGKDRKVNSRSNKIGTKKTLVFYKGRAPHGERSDWLMHEYRLEASQCKGGTNLQDLYVLSRVFRKPKQDLNDQESIQEVIFPMSNNPLSPTDVSDGDVEDQSEERSSLVKQEDDTLASSGLRSETSSEILDNKVEDNNCIEGPGELLQDGSNPNCNLVSLHDTSINENVDSQWGSQKLQSDTSNLPWNEEDFPQIPDNPYFANDDYWQDDNSDLTSLLDYYPELDAFLCPMEEENIDGSSVTELPTSIVDNGIQIQIRSRPEWWQSPQQLPSQGTAMRRIRLQLHKTEESADGRKEHLLTDCSSDDSDGSDDSEVITQLEDSQLASSPSQISCCVVEDDADSDIFHDSVESSEIVENGHELSLAPTQLLPSSLFPVGAASVKSVMSVNSKESGGQSVLVEKSESVVSSTYNQSLSLAASPTITIVQDESGSPKEHFNDFTSNDSFTSVTREQTLTGESKRVQKCTVSEDDSRVKAPGQVCVLSDDSLKGEKLVSCGISSTQVQMEMTVLHTTSSQEMELVSVNSSALGLESPTVLASNVSVSEVAASFGSRQLGAVSSNNNAVAETHMSYKGSGNFTGFNGILSGLKPRGKSRPNYVASDHVEESTNVTHNFSDHCSKDSWKVFSSLEKALGIFIQPSQPQSKISKGANCILLICLLSTALLVLCIWNKWHLARSSSTIIL